MLLKASNCETACRWPGSRSLWLLFLSRGELHQQADTAAPARLADALRRRHPPQLDASSPAASIPASAYCPHLTLQEDLALIISNTKRRPRMVKEKSPSGYHSG